MRSLLALVPFVAACTSVAGGPDSPSFASVRDRLEAAPTRLFVAAQANAGSVDARRWTHDGWQDGTTAVSITSGELFAATGATDLTLSKIVIGLEPLDIPEVVFGKPAQLTDVRFTLVSAAAAPATWTGDDAATATPTLVMDLDWSLSIDNSKSPLGTQHLPPLAVGLTLGGTGAHVDATLTVPTTGELWSWAGLLELTQLELALDAGTVDES